ncbi:MAG TPA: response regulator [Gemmatimonadales bacterium]|nr:response regulator [Gemmatimonadales bacterium]
MTAGPAPAAGTILVVEDHSDTRRLVDHTLRGSGYQVIAASGGTEAVSLVTAHPGEIVLLISEVLLWGMTGAELYGRIRQKHHRLRVLFMSGFTDQVLRQHGISPTAVPFLRKPFGPPALVEKVREVLQSPAPNGGGSSGSSGSSS